MSIRERGGELLEKLRKTCPLIHHITNYVTVNDCANAVLAIGASPIMADDIREAADITALADALVLNIGTLDERTVASMLASGKKANERRIPVVLDPVGAGASAFRNETVQALLQEIDISIVRGNLSELAFIAGLGSAAKGVDSGKADENKDVFAVAKIVAQKYACVAALTGATDVITDGVRTIRLRNGHPMLAKVTGTGCMTSALVASFAAISDHLVLAASCGVAAMGISGEIAYEKTGHLGTGSFHMAIFDALSHLDAAAFTKWVKADETEN